MKTVEEYRQFAKDCRKLALELTARKTSTPLELMAKAWDKVANEREASLKRISPLQIVEDASNETLSCCEVTV